MNIEATKKNTPIELTEQELEKVTDGWSLRHGDPINDTFFQSYCASCSSKTVADETKCICTGCTNVG